MAVTNHSEQPGRSSDGNTMDGMAQTPAHAKPAHRDHLWVLVIIAACTLIEVWATWLGLGSVSGFPKLGSMTTGWVLAVSTEAYWAYALFAWLAVPAGLRSRRFAMWSAVVMFLLSLGGQESGHLLSAAKRAQPPAGVVMLVTALPLVSLALIAVLIHLRQRDREEAAEAGRAAAEAQRQAGQEAAAADERTALRAQLEELREAYETAESGRADAESRAVRQDELEASLEAERSAREAAEERATEAGRTAQEGEAEREILARKLDAANAKIARNARAKKGANSPRNGSRSSRATKVPDDVDARAEALAIHDAEPGISGAELGRRVGMSPRWGQLRKDEFAAAAPKGQDPQE